MYSESGNLIFGFHGCTKDVCDKLVLRQDEFRISENEYDWLGPGIYFWEDNLERAWKWAEDLAKEQGKEPAVIGAIIQPGHCLDLLDQEGIKIFKEGYELLKLICEVKGIELPKNEKTATSDEYLRKKLNMKIFSAIQEGLIGEGLSYNPDNVEKPHRPPVYDTIRGAFTEGEEIVPFSGIYEKQHVQIAVANPDCILGVFIP